jgi:integrase
LLEASFGREQVKSITPQKLWKWLKKQKQLRNWSRQTLQNYTRVLTRFFNYAFEKGFVAENPLLSKTIAFEKGAALRQTGKEPPAIIALKDARALLRAAHDTDEQRGFLTFVVLCMFCGLRPEAEAVKLEWDQIDMADRLVYIHPQKSKNTKSARSVEICDVALEWLLLCNQSKQIGPVNWVSNWKKLRNAAGIMEWKGDTLRHSFASYGFAMHRNKGRLITDLGHVDDQMLNYYLQVTPLVKKNAKHYFDLTPDKVLGPDECNVVPMEVTG